MSNKPSPSFSANAVKPGASSPFAKTFCRAALTLSDALICFSSLPILSTLFSKTVFITCSNSSYSAFLAGLPQPAKVADNIKTVRNTDNTTTNFLLIFDLREILQGKKSVPSTESTPCTVPPIAATQFPAQWKTEIRNAYSYPLCRIFDCVAYSV